MLAANALIVKYVETLVDTINQWGVLDLSHLRAASLFKRHDAVKSINLAVTCTTYAPQLSLSTLLVPPFYRWI